MAAVESTDSTLTKAEKSFEKVMKQFQDAFNQDPEVIRVRLKKKVGAIVVDFSSAQSVH